MKTKKEYLIHDIKTKIYENKLEYFFVYLLSQLLPIFDGIIIYFIYLMVDKQKMNNFISSSENFYMTENIFSSLDEKHIVYIIFIFTIFSVLLFLTMKYIRDKRSAHINYKIFVSDANNLFTKYISNDFLASSKIDQEKLASSIFFNSGISAKIISSGFEMFTAIIQLMIYLVMVFFINPIMLLIGLVINVIPLLINKKLIKKLDDVGQEKVESEDELISFFSKFSMVLKRMKLDGIEDSLSIESLDILNRSRDWRVRKRVIQSAIAVLSDGTSLVALILFAFAGQSILNLSSSDILAVFIIFSRGRTANQRLINHFAMSRQLLPQLWRYKEQIEYLNSNLLDNVTKISSGKKVFEIKHIKLDNINFSYGTTNILQSVHMELNAGDRIFIDGKSGSGKSTLIEIISGLMQNNNLNVSYNDKKLNSSLFYEYRSKIHLSSPDIFLFNRSLKYNLSLGRNISEDEIFDALRNSCLNVDLIKKYINNSVGENGDNLSLGQRQRVILSRLFLKKPNLIILDEATANVDIETEDEIFKNIINYIPKNSILVVVAHRIPRLIQFNKIYSVKNKKVQLDT